MLIPEIITTEHTLKSTYLRRVVGFNIFMPANLLGNEELNLLLLNDGQDAGELGLQQTLQELHVKRQIGTTIAVAIKASEDRIQEYGVAGKTDFLNRGSKADDYTAFVMKELLPFLYKTIDFPIHGIRAFVGFSLGGLSAFDVAWNNDKAFDVVGVLSGSFWWRKKDLKDGYTDADRIIHQVIKDTAKKPALKFWLMTGTEDEKADRNKNYIIDSIDDTIDVIKELLAKGYKRPDDIFYYEAVGGQHNVATWAKVLPAFLKWAFPAKRV